MSTIRELALKLLEEVVYYEAKADAPGPDNVHHGKAGDHKYRSVGLPYADILAQVKDAFPNCRTNLSGLRWYAVKMRSDDPGFPGTVPGRRPRHNSKRNR